MQELIIEIDKMKSLIEETNEMNRCYFEFLSKCFPDEMLQELNELTYAQHMPLYDIVYKACKEYLDKHRDEVWLDQVCV